MSQTGLVFAQANYHSHRIEKDSVKKRGRVGVDLARNMYQLHGVDRHGKRVGKRRLRRGQWLQALIDGDAILKIGQYFNCS